MKRLHRIPALLLLAALTPGLAASDAWAASPPAGHQLRSSTSTAVTAVPQVPFIVSIAPSGLSALLTWAPNPEADQVSAYSATAVPDSTPVPSGCGSPTPSTALGTDSAMIVGGLCAAVAYTITLTAANAAGTGPASAGSNPVVPLPAQLPSAPLFTSVLGRDTALIATWSAPASDGGSAITGYKVRATAGTTSVTVITSAATTQATITGLTDGVKYTLGLQAINAIGKSAAATSSGTPTAAYPPGPALQFSARPDGSGGVIAGWAAPFDEGGDAIAGYNVTYQQVVPNSAGTGWVPASGSTSTTVSTAGSVTSLTVSSFNPSAAYYSFSIAAFSAAGTGQIASIATPVTPTTQLNSNAVVLAQATMDALGSDVQGTLTWPAPAPAQVGSLQVGQAIVGPTSAAAANGVLAKITSITQPTSGTYAVGTTPAALSDVLVDGSYAQNLNPLTSGATFHATAPGVRAIHRPGAVSFSTTVTLGIDLEADLGSNTKVHVSGSVDLTPTVTVDLTLQQGFPGVPDGGTIAASGTVDAAASITFQLEVSGAPLKTEVGEIHGDPVIFFIGPVPVVMLPKVAVFLQLGGSIAIGVSASVTVGAAMVWNSANPGTLQTQNLTTPLRLTAGRVPGLAVSATASIGLVAQVETQLYDAAGPDVSATLQLTATMDFNPPPNTPFLSLKPSVQLAVGLNVDVLSIKGQVSVTLATLPFPSFVIKSAPTVTMTVGPNNAFVGPGQQLTLSATRSDGFTFPVTWSLQGAIQADSISSGGVLTPAPPGGRSLTVVATDSTGVSGSATVLVAIAPFDSPQNLKVYVDNPAASATLLWAAPLNTGGAPLATYSVSTQPGTTTQTLGATATTATVSGLTPGTVYTFLVVATNSAGMSSSAATVIAQDIASPWKIVPIPGLSGTENNLAAVSCVSATFCAAVGDANSQPLAEMWNGRKWAIVPTPNSGNGGLTGVSCLSARSCTAVGLNAAPVGGPTTLIEVWNGTTWSIVPTSNSSSNLYVPESVTCLSSKFCTLVGYQTPLGSVQQALVETWNGTAWSIVPTPSVSATAALLDGVSCVSRTSCTAVGYLRNTAFEVQPLVESWNGSVWSAVPTPPVSGGKNWLVGVSCVSAVYCTTVGFSVPTQTLIETWDGSIWSIVPSPIVNAPKAELFGVSCLSASSCTAVGFFNDSTGTAHTLVEIWDGTSWSIVPSPNDNDNNLQGVSCLTTGPCTAVGQFFDAVSTFYFPLVEVS
jgi:hypothetical protein